MDLGIKYRGRVATTEDAAFINNLIEDNPNDSRRALSIKLCRAWNWRQANGALRDMVCRGFMLELHRAGHIHLPAKKCFPNNPLVNRKTPEQITIDQSPLFASLKNVRPLRFCQVRRSGNEKLFNSLIDTYHYRRGKDDHTMKQNRSLKAVYGYPLSKDFRTKLAGGGI